MTKRTSALAHARAWLFGRTRTRPRTHARLLPAVLALALGPLAASAQETDTVRLGTPDTIAPADTFAVVDSILEPDDTLTLERDSVPADTLPPPRLVPLRLPEPLEPTYANGVRVWYRQELLRSTALNVADLIERVPGLTRVRAGYYTQPELVVAPSALSGDVEVLLDGYPLDPLTSTTVDLSRIGLGDLERVRVERRGSRLRIELTPLEHPVPRGDYGTSPDSGSAYTRVEIATGDLDTDGLAGVFMAPRFLFGPFAASIGRLNSEGLARSEPGRSTSAWLRWSYLRDRWGVHAEYRRNGVERDPSSAFPGEATRQDMIVRARVRPWPTLTAELYAGHSEVDDVFIDTVSTRLSGTNVGARAAYARAWLNAEGAVRVRNGDVGPDLAWRLAGDARPLRWLSLNADFDVESWESESAARWVVGAAAGPFLGARAFAEVADGSHGIHWLTREGGAPVVDRTSQRVGVDWVLGGWRLGAAAFRAEGDSVAPPAIPGIGLAGDRTLALHPGFETRGFEVSFRIPLVYQPVGLEGGYTRISAAEEGTLAVFQPVEHARVAIAWHDLPLESTQFEVDARLSLDYRGEMLVPNAVDGSIITVGAHPRLDFDLSLRVLDIHAYVSWQNILHETELNDLPGRPLPGQTAYFGVKWELWN